MDKKTLREAQSKLGEARAFVETVRDDLQEKFDEKSENWQQSDKGQEAEEKITDLTSVVETLEEMDTAIENAMK